MLPSGLFELSTDKFIENAAAEEGKTYNALLAKFYQDANAVMWKEAEEASSKRQSVVWNQTNLTKAIREKKLSKLHNYYKVGIVLEKPDDETWLKILDSRPGKTIPPNKLQEMQSLYEEPTLDEGFEWIIRVRLT